MSGVYWAIADFTPSASAASGVQAEFQDGTSTGIFSQRPGGSWQLVQTGPYGCGRGLPSGLSQAWGLPAPVICQAAMTTQRSAASAALSQAGNASTIGQSIAKVALGQVGVGDSPAATSFSGVDCDPYTSLVGALSPNADGCGYNTSLSVADENEAWCSDFAKWVWEQAGVTTDMAAINAGLDALERTKFAEAPSIGEISVACALGYIDFRLPEIEWRATRPKLAEWLARFEKYPSMIATAPKAS